MLNKNRLTGRVDALGFTLIELLVVVLIIGILAAIALPQYKKAVLKSHLATLKAIVEPVSKAIELYRLNNGDYPHTYEELDVTVPPPLRTVVNGLHYEAQYPWGYCSLKYNKTQTVQEYFLFCYYVTGGSEAIGYGRYFPGSTTMPVGAKCRIRPGDKISTSICKQETGQAEPISGTRLFHYPNS